jgi:hypothetical protein
MNKSIIKIFILILTLCQVEWVLADTPEKAPQQGNKWMEEVKHFKHSFLIKEVEMTDEQSNEFLPLYKEMEEKIYQVNKEARLQEKEISVSSQDITEEVYEKAAKSLSQVKTKEAEIENQYFEIFSTILSKKQLFLLKRAENRFAIEMLNYNKQSKKTNE